MAAEAEAHRREQLVAERMLDPAAIARVKGGGQHVGGHLLLHRGIDGPLALARVGDAAGEMLELLVLGEADRDQVVEPRRDDTAAPPYLGDIGQVQVEPLLLGKLVGEVAVEQGL